MKYFLNLLLVLFFTLIGFSQTSSTNTQVTFGRYGGQGQPCVSGRGVCSFSVSAGQTENSIVSKKVNETTFLLQISRSAINSEDQTQILGKKIIEIKENETLTFIQSEDLVLENTLLQKLQIDSRYNKISAGNYTVRLTKEYIEIYFTLKVTQ